MNWRTALALDAFTFEEIETLLGVELPRNPLYKPKDLVVLIRPGWEGEQGEVVDVHKDSESGKFKYYIYLFKQQDYTYSFEDEMKPMEAVSVSYTVEASLRSLSWDTRRMQDDVERESDGTRFPEPKSSRWFVEHYGTRCPACGSKDIEETNFDGDYAKAYCRSCDALWYSIYRLVGYDMLEL